MNTEEVSLYTLEGATAVLLLVVAFKIYKIKCHSACRLCGDGLVLEGENPGGERDV